MLWTDLRIRLHELNLNLSNFECSMVLVNDWNSLCMSSWSMLYSGCLEADITLLRDKIPDLFWIQHHLHCRL
jgi:hypothetical protein